MNKIYKKVCYVKLKFIFYAFDKFIFLTLYNNNFIMTETAQAEAILESTAKLYEESDLSNKKEIRQLQSQEKYESEFINPISISKATLPKDSNLSPKKQQSKILSTSRVEKSLRQIYSYYSQSYVQQIKQCQGFDLSIENKLKLQAFLLFAKNFNILRTILSVQRITVMFKKQANFGKHLTFDNFHSLIDSMSHQPQTITHLRLEKIVQQLDKETREQLEKQEFYNYLKLGSSKKYRKNYTDLFGAFNILEKPRNDRVKSNYKKLSLPLIKRKQIPEYKKRDISEIKMRYEQKDIKNIVNNQKYVLSLKPESQPQKSSNNEIKQIMVSWQILKSKSVNNLGKPSENVNKPYLKIDPEQEDPYLKQLQPGSKQFNLNISDKYESQQQKKGKKERKNKIEHQIEQIQKRESIKNQQIINRIDKQLQIRSNRKFKV